MPDRSRVADAAADLSRGLLAAQLLMPCPDVVASAGGVHHGTGSAPPWNASAANAYLDAHEGLRRLEPSLRAEVAGHPGQRRGGSDANTYRALDAVVALAEALPAADAHIVTRILTRWCNATQRLVAIDTRSRWLPIRAGTPPSPWACPYCRTWSLRIAERSGIVMCFYPGGDGQGCKDGDGNVPHGRLGRSRLTGNPVLDWDDGLVQGAA